MCNLFLLCLSTRRGTFMCRVYSKATYFLEILLKRTVIFTTHVLAFPATGRGSRSRYEADTAYAWRPGTLPRVTYACTIAGSADQICFSSKDEIEHCQAGS